MRVEFVCGLRAVRAARIDAAILSEITALLSTAPEELLATIARHLGQAKASARELQKIREELAIFQAAQVVSEVPIENGLRLVVREWKDRDRDYVRLLASRTAAAAASTAVIFCAKESRAGSRFPGT